MKNINEILLNIEYTENKTFSKGSIFTDNEGNQYNSIAISTEESLSDSTLIFDTALGLYKKAEKRQNIITETLNAETEDEINKLFSDYGFWTVLPQHGRWYQCLSSEIDHTLETLKRIIIIKNEVSKEEPDFRSLFNAYSFLIKYGKIDINVEGNSYNVNPIKNNFIFDWNFNGEMEDLSVHVEEHKMFSSNESFFDPMLDKNINVENVTLDDIKDWDPSEQIGYAYGNLCHFDNDDEINAICFFKYLLDKNNIELYNEVTYEHLDTLAEKKLLEFAEILANSYIDIIMQQTPWSLSITGEPTLMIPNMLCALAFSLSRFDYKRYCIDTCKKPSCNKHFVRSINRITSQYCCEAHAKSEAQRKFRKKNPK